MTIIHSSRHRRGAVFLAATVVATGVLLAPAAAAFAGAHPLRERPRGLLMLALYRTGRQAEALGVFRETSRLLSEELGLRPSAELRALERSILNQDPRLRPRYGRRSDLVDQVGH